MQNEMPGPTPDPLGDDLEHGYLAQERDIFKRMERRVADHIANEIGTRPDQGTDGAKNSLPVLGTELDYRDDESIGSWEKGSVKSSRPTTPVALPVRRLGLSRRTGWTDYNDYE